MGIYIVRIYHDASRIWIQSINQSIRRFTYRKFFFSFFRFAATEIPVQNRCARHRMCLLWIWLFATLLWCWKRQYSSTILSTTDTRSVRLVAKCLRWWARSPALERRLRTHASHTTGLILNSRAKQNTSFVVHDVNCKSNLQSIADTMSSQIPWKGN